MSDAQFLAQKKIKLFLEPIASSKETAISENVKELCCFAFIVWETEFGELFEYP